MLRYRRIVVLFATVAVVFSGGLVRSQDGGEGRGGSAKPRLDTFGLGGIIGLAGQPAVQKEIGLDDEAAAKVKRIVASFREESQLAIKEAGADYSAQKSLDDLSPEERESKLREIGEKRSAITKKLNEKFVPQLKDLLSAAQAERLQQIDCQIAGSAALVRPELSKLLKLTKEQQGKIREINQEFAKKQREAREIGRGLRTGPTPADLAAFKAANRERGRKMSEISKEHIAKAIEVLSSEQQEAYSKLTGKPFDLRQTASGDEGDGDAPGARAQNKDDKK